MKKEWSAASIEELNINETANGIFRADIETLILFKDGGDDSKSDTPDNNENQLS